LTSPDDGFDMKAWSDERETLEELARRLEGKGNLVTVGSLSGEFIPVNEMERGANDAKKEAKDSPGTPSIASTSEEGEGFSPDDL
jgi:hypothetical protein